jgi:hypothetical protein
MADSWFMVSRPGLVDYRRGVEALSIGPGALGAISKGYDRQRRHLMLTARAAV